MHAVQDARTDPPTLTHTFFRGKKKSLRGQDADIIFVDEAAFVPLEMFWEVVVPLLGMKNSVLFMSSTPVDTFNFFTKLMDLRDPDTGHPVFLVANIVCFFSFTCLSASARTLKQVHL